MNLNKNPSLDQLKLLVNQCDDSKGDHLLYVKIDGEVRIHRFARKNDWATWVEDNPDDIMIRFEYFPKGQGYVGINLRHEKWVDRLFKALIDAWANVEPVYPAYIDFY